MKIHSFIFLLMFAGIVAACSTSSDSDTDSLTLTFSGLEPLQNGFHYEGWVLINGNAITTGKFNVNDNGEIVDLSGSAIPNGEFDVDADLASASVFILTIEPGGDTDDIPAVTHHLAGGITNGTASLSMMHNASLGSDFMNAVGEYILATPSDGGDSNELSGIWFLNPDAGTSTLSLPDLPNGWVYEGWAVADGTPLSTGTFTSVEGADNAAPFSGNEPTPPFPGEDFLMNAPSGLTFPLDLSGGTVVISVEPSPDDSPAPFALKPLVGQIPDAATAFTLYTLQNNSASFPSGTVRIN